MYSQLLHRILIIYIQQSVKFFRVVDSDSGLDGDISVPILIYTVQKALQPLQITESACPLPLGSYCPGGTAQIDIDFLIAKIPQLLLKAVEILCRNSHNLRNQIIAFVMLRQHLSYLFIIYCPFRTGRKKRCVVFVRSCPEKFMKGISEQIPCYALHRC